MAHPVHVRPLHQHRSSQSRTGCRSRRAGRLAALAALGLLCATTIACGGNSEPKATPAASGANPDGTLTASGLVPNLDDLGYKVAQQGKEPAAAAGLDSALVLYQKPGGAQSVQLRIYVFPEAANAERQWSAYAEAFRNPPPDVLGTASKNLDSSSPPLGQLQKSYVTDKPDGAGNLVWTDIYRQGRVVVLVQVLDTAKGDGMAIRKAVAERILTRVK